MDLIQFNSDKRIGCVGALFGLVLVVGVIFLIYTFFHYEDLMDAVAWTVRSVAIFVGLALVCGTILALVFTGFMDNPFLRWTNPEKYHDLQCQKTLHRIFGDLTYDKMDDHQKELYNNIISTYHDRTIKRWKPDS